MLADHARQRQQFQRHLERQPVGADVLGDRGLLGVLLVALLDVGPEAPAAQRHALAKVGRPVGHRRVAALPELLGIFALGIIGAGDEAPNLPPRSASRPVPHAGQSRGSLPSSFSGNSHGARNSSSAAVTSDGFCSITSPALGLKSFQNASSNCCQPSPPARHVVEPFLELGGIIVIDIALEEALEERRHQPPALLGDEAVLVGPDIFAVLQRLQRRGIGRRPPDAELLQPLDQARFGIARRRLGEALRRLDPVLGRRIAGLEQRHPRAVLVVGLFVAAFFVEREIAGEEHDLPGRAQRRAARAVGQFDRRPLEPRRRHLARQRAVEDQRIELGMVARPRRDPW